MRPGSRRARTHPPIKTHQHSPREEKQVKTKRIASAVAMAAIAAGGSVAAVSATATARTARQAATQNVSLMVGGWDKQIYLEYKLADDLGYFKKYGINMTLSTEQQGGVGAEQAMVAGNV